MRPAGTQILGFLSGAVMMGAALFAAGEGGIARAGSVCQGKLPAVTRDQAPARIPLRVSKITLPAPPPSPAPLVVTAPRSSPPARAKPSPDRATKNQGAVRPKPGAVKPRASKKPMATPNTLRLPLKAGRDQEVAGGPLLRLLEHGEGPSVEIAWPGHAVARAKLYDLLRRCHGLKTVLLRDQEILMPTGVGGPETFNGDLHSGFLRAVLGSPPRREARLIKKLRARHGTGGAVPARLLSRQFDARLLGGLSRLVGAGYRGAKTVNARYAIAGNRVMVHGLVVDGRVIEGRIEIDPPGRCRGGGG